jgi:hypothetical protein
MASSDPLTDAASYPCVPGLVLPATGVMVRRESQQFAGGHQPPYALRDQEPLTRIKRERATVPLARGRQSLPGGRASLLSLSRRLLTGRHWQANPYPGPLVSV